MQPRLLRSPARLAGVALLQAQSDERLVALARDGHERAFAVIVERYRAQLERYAGRLVGPERGEDAVQQAFINAHTDLLRHPDRTIELRPWLYRIVHNTSLNTLRSSHDEASLGEAAERLSLSEDAVERRERLREALAAVAALPPQQRDAILLRELEGRSHEEIAHALNVSPGAARQQIFRARAALRAALTALTPQPLLIRLLEMAAAPAASPSAELATAGASAGLAAVLAKAGATLVVGGAVVGGAVGTGAVDLPSHDDGASGSPAAIVAPERPSASSATPIAAARAGEDAQARRGSGGAERADDSSGSGSGRGDDTGRRGGGDSSGPGAAGTGTGLGDDDDRSGPSEHSGKGKSGGGTGDSSDDDSTTDGDSGKGKSGGGTGDSSGDDGTTGDDSGKGISSGGPEATVDSSGEPSGGSPGGGGDGSSGGDSGGSSGADALTPQAPTEDALSSSGSDTRNETSSSGSSGGSDGAG